MQALLDKYDWQMKQDPTTPVVIISAKEPNAVEPQVMKVILLGYSDPTNIVAEVSKALPDPRHRHSGQPHPPSDRPHHGKGNARRGKAHRPLDSATGQILIEAKIIETTKDISTAKGIDWTGTPPPSMSVSETA